MSQPLRTLITIVIAFVFILGQGLSAFSASDMACCPNMVVQSHSSCCDTVNSPVHKLVKPSGVMPASCFCNLPDQTLQSIPSQLEQVIKLVGVSAPANPTQTLQLAADTDSPIWLYQRFYPDRSRLYQQKNSWLL